MQVSVPDEFNVAAHFVDRNVAEGRGDSVAVLSGDEQLTYRDVLAQVNRAGNALGRLGVSRGDRVLLLLLDSPAFVAAFWGAIKLGAVAVPVNTLLTSEDYGFILRDSGARALVVDSSLLDKVEPHLPAHAGACSILVAGEPARGLPSFETALAKASAELAPASTRRDDPAFWLYTSGSTGAPKAAIHRHRDMVHCFESYAQTVLGISARDRAFSASKLFFAYGLGNALYFPFAAGASTVLLPERPTPERIFEVIARYRPTLFFAVPTHYAGLLQVSDDEKKCDLGSVRLAISAGEALPAPLLEKFRARFGLDILDGIGSTEMLHMFISNRAGDVMPGSSGKLLPGYDARLTDEQGREVADGQIGNLWIRGPSAAAGYWNRPERSAATFVGGWTLTGDKYIRDREGFYWHCGRSDDMLKVAGLWVSPLEIESALLAHPAVVEAAVVGAADADGLIKPKAFVVAKPPADLLEAGLRDFLHTRLAGYKVPHWIEVVDALPKTATGKIQRFKLREAAR